MQNRSNDYNVGRIRVRTAFISVILSVLFLFSIAVLVNAGTGDGVSPSDIACVSKTDSDNSIVYSGSEADDENKSSTVSNSDEDKKDDAEDKKDEVSGDQYTSKTAVFAMTTSKKVGDEIVFDVTLNGAENNDLYLDAGDGKFAVVEPESDGSYSVTLKGSTVKIAGARVNGKFADIKAIDCSNQSLTALTLSNLPALESLECSDNSLKKLDVSKCKQLKDLFCSDNELGTLNLTSNSKLDTLQCSNNKLTSLSLCGDSPLLLYMDGNEDLKTSGIKLWASNPVKLGYTERNVGSSADASEFDVMIDNGGDPNESSCKFAWYNASTNKPVEGETSSIMYFGDEDVGKSFYCLITSSIGTSVKTTAVKVIPAPMSDVEDSTSTVDTSTPSANLVVVDKDKNVLNEGEYKLVVTDLSGDVKDKVLAAMKKVNSSFDATKTNTYSIYDISLQTMDGEDASIKTGNIRVSLIYPTLDEGKTPDDYTFTVYHYTGDKLVKVTDVNCDDSNINFRASSFSPYVVTWQFKKSTGDTSSNSPATGDSILTTIAAIYAIFFCILLVGTVCIKLGLVKGRKEFA